MTNRGRPVNQSRETAKLLGDVTYEGKRCLTCNNTARYTLNAGCVECTRAASLKRKPRKSQGRTPVSSSENRLHDATGTLLERGWFGGRPASQADDDLEDLLGGTVAQKNQVASESNTPSASGTQEGYYTPTQCENMCASVPADESAAGSMASPPSLPPCHGNSETNRDEKLKPRYWCHAESGCVWKILGDDRPGIGDGFVEEISAESYADLLKAGFEDSTVNDADDLSDILG